MLMLSKRYESAEDNRWAWLLVLDLNKDDDILILKWVSFSLHSFCG